MRTQDATSAAELETYASSFELTASSSEPMRALERTLEQIAPSNLPIVLAGESGTGKSFLAQHIHRLSSRRKEPLVRAICSRLTGEGAAAYFDRAADKRNGLNGPGTLFLKEISEMSTETQRSLLYAISEGDPETSGEDGPRLISSTSTDLEAEASAGRFRGDLYYRLRGVCLHLPPLRERKEDVPRLCELLLSKHAMLQGKPRPSLDKDDLALLQEWSWPGNCRELENTVRQMVILNDPKRVLYDCLGGAKEHGTAFPAEAGAGRPLRVATRAASRRVEEQLILDALTRTRWNRKRAAQSLQISYKSLLSKLKQIGVDKPEKS